MSKMKFPLLRGALGQEARCVVARGLGEAHRPSRRDVVLAHHDGDRHEAARVVRPDQVWTTTKKQARVARPHAQERIGRDHGGPDVQRGAPRSSGTQSCRSPRSV